MAVEGVDRIGDVLPVFLAEVAPIELDESAAPSVDEGGGCLFRPAIFTDRHGTGIGGRSGG